MKRATGEARAQTDGVINSDGSGQGGTRWYGSCSTKYVRGREAQEARIPDQLQFAFIVDCN